MAFAISNVAQGLGTSEQGLFSSFRSLAYTLTLKEVFERKNKLQGAKDEWSCSLQEQVRVRSGAQKEKKIFFQTSLSCTICTTEKLGLIHKRGEVISRGSTQRFESKSSKRR